MVISKKYNSSYQILLTPSKCEGHIDYEKKTIQGNLKNDSNSDYKWYKRLYNNNKFGKRQEYVKIVRNILIDMELK